MIHESILRSFTRSIGMSVLLTMVVFYAIHVFGSWRVENYRPHPDTTFTVLLHNNCLLFDKTHTLRPNTDISKMDNSSDGTKWAGSFMIFFEGHIGGMVILSLVLAVVIFALRRMILKNRLVKGGQHE